jgi:hypothetical protein
LWVDDEGGCGTMRREEGECGWVGRDWMTGKEDVGPIEL